MKKWKPSLAAIADEGPLQRNRTRRDQRDIRLHFGAECARGEASRGAHRTHINNLGDFPEMGQETREAGVRRIPAGRYPYLVYYTVEAEEVVILHVRYGARRWPWEDED